MRNYLCKTLGVTFFFILACTAVAQKLAHAAEIVDDPVLSEKRLQLKQIFTEIPQTSKRALTMSFSSEAIWPWAAIFGSTAILVEDDERWLSESKRFGTKMGWSPQDRTQTKSTLASYDLLRLPTDKGSAVYFLGDGWLHMSVAGGFLLSGAMFDTTKPFNTGVEMVHAMVTSTLFNQALKRSFGRETPNFATKPRGAMRPFPGFKNYGEQTAKYDAMPSGHIMTVTSQFTIFQLNYPQYTPWTLGVAALWGGALMIQMANNGVHWWSDYPLGIAMGYVFGRQAYNMGHRGDIRKENRKNDNYAFLPFITREEVAMSWIWQF